MTEKGEALSFGEQRIVIFALTYILNDADAMAFLVKELQVMDNVAQRKAISVPAANANQ